MNSTTEKQNEAMAVNENSGFAFDPEIGAALTVLFATDPPPLMPERGDWKSLREMGNSNMADWAAQAPSFPEVKTKTFFTSSHDGAEIELRWYIKNGGSTGSAIVYAHGGGLILGDLDKYDGVVSAYVDSTGVPFLAVQYRTAPEVQGTCLAEDVFAGLKFLIENATELGVDVNRIALMGDSAGGGVAAGAAILARDRGIPLAIQILIYAMLDDRNLQPDEHLLPYLTWTYDNNFTGWSALLGDALGTDEVSPVAVPARLKDFSGLAPAFIEVGELDLFRDEDIAYAQSLNKAGISAELHLLPGAPHGYDRFVPTANITLRAMADRLRVIKSV